MPRVAPHTAPSSRTAAAAEFEAMTADLDLAPIARPDTTIPPPTHRPAPSSPRDPVASSAPAGNGTESRERVRPPAPHAAQRIVVKRPGANGNGSVTRLPNVVTLAAALREATRETEHETEEQASEAPEPRVEPPAAEPKPAARIVTAPAAPARTPEVTHEPEITHEPESRPESVVTDEPGVRREPEAEREKKRGLGIGRGRKTREREPKAERGRKAKRGLETERGPKAEREPKAERKKKERAPKAERARKPARASKEPKEKLSRKDRRLRRQTAALYLCEGETLTRSLDGRSRFRRATLLLTNYRVAVVSRSRRRRTVRWIPLEEVSQIDTAWRGAPTVMIEASIESLTFNNRSGASLAEMVETLETEVREARAPGTRRHHPEIIQAWCDRTGEVWDSSAGRLRLWIRRHPVFTLTWLASLIPLAYFAAPR